MQNPVEHKISLVPHHVHAPTKWHAECTCGWEGPLRKAHAGAARDGDKHLGIKAKKPAGLVTYFVNVDGSKHALVSAATMAEAARLLGVSVARMRAHASQTRNERHLATTAKHPRTPLFTTRKDPTWRFADGTPVDGQVEELAERVHRLLSYAIQRSIPVDIGGHRLYAEEVAAFFDEHEIPQVFFAPGESP